MKKLFFILLSTFTFAQQDIYGLCGENIMDLNTDGFQLKTSSSSKKRT